MADKRVKRARLQAWSLWLFPVVFGLGAFLMWSVLPSPDRVPNRGPQAVLVGLVGLVLVLTTLNQTVVQTYSYLVGKPLEPMPLESTSKAGQHPPGFLQRRIDGWVSRVIGQPRSSQRRRSYLLAGGILCGLWVLRSWSDYYYPSATDTGRDMTKLNVSRITYLTPGDVKRLPTIGIGGSWSFSRVKRITPAVALVLAEETAHLSLGLDGLKSLDNLALKRLVARPGNLSLDGLESLTDEQAEILGRHHNGYLSLDGVKSLSIASAKALARHKETIYLQGLKEIDDDALFELQSVAKISDELFESRREARRAKFLRGKEGRETKETEESPR